MSSQLSKRQQQRNEQILRDLIKYMHTDGINANIFEESQGITNVQIVLLLIQIGQALTLVIFIFLSN